MLLKKSIPEIAKKISTKILLLFERYQK